MAGSVLSGGGQSVGASTEACLSGSEQSVFSGVLQQVPGDAYEVYARVAKRGQRAEATVALRADGEHDECVLFETRELSGDSWVKVGEWSTDRRLGFVTIELTSAGLAEASGINRPSVLLVSATKPACVLKSGDCITQVDGRQATVLPTSSLVDQESLRVVRPIAPNEDDLRKVTFFVDNKPVYTTSSLQPFDIRYATHHGQEVVAVAEYTSGQRVAIEESLPKSYIASPGTLLFQVFQTNTRFYLSLVIGLGVFVLGAVTLAGIRILEQRQAWRRAHGLIPQGVSRTSPREVAFWARISTVKVWARRSMTALLLVATLFGLVAAISEYIGTRFQVRGTSMENSYVDGDSLWVDKIPISWGLVAGRNYIPKRGEVVIARAVYGIVDPQVSADMSKNYIIKRVVGLPGERVVMKNGKISVYTSGEQVVDPDEGVAWAEDIQSADNHETIDITLRSDELFLAGDNRSASIDSRFNGAIATDRVVGVVRAKF